MTIKNAKIKLFPLFSASLFIIHGASYGICAPFSGWLCDKVRHLKFVFPYKYMFK